MITKIKYSFFIIALCYVHTNFAMFQRIKEFAIDYSPFHFSHTSADFKDVAQRPYARRELIHLETMYFREVGFFMGLLLPLWIANTESVSLPCNLVKVSCLLAGSALGCGGGTLYAMWARSHQTRLSQAIKKHSMKKMFTGVALALMSVGIVYAQGDMGECLSF